LLRKRFFEDLEGLTKGKEPKALIRDPRVNECVSLPIAHRSVFVDGLTLDELVKHPVFGAQLRGYVFQAGQPEEVRGAYEDAMGLNLQTLTTETRRHREAPRH